MKIDVRYKELLKKKSDHYKLSRKIKTGFISAVALVGIPAMMFSNKNKGADSMNDNYQNVGTYQEAKTEDPINVDINEVNELNIIINDNDCSDTFMESIYNNLEADGIKFKTTKNSENIDVDDSVIITLDQQYISGPGMLVIAPYDNERRGNSDALALACEASFYENGFFTDGIECGKKGFREMEDGTIMERIPTSTEENISSDKNTSFVTICFGTDNTNPLLVTASIEGMLTRYCSYIKNGNKDEDLIYRTEKDDTYDSLTAKYGYSENYLKLMNNLDTEELPIDSTIKNPDVKDIREFDTVVPVNLYVEKTKWSK